MIHELNEIELAILHRVAAKHPSLNEHIPHLRVRDRVYTGVGMYINFVYVNLQHKPISASLNNATISTNERIMLSELEYGLCYEVNITAGRIKFIELVTYGEEWNGKFDNQISFK